jgi:hypothetical protein
VDTVDLQRRVSALQNASYSTANDFNSAWVDLLTEYRGKAFDLASSNPFSMPGVPAEYTELVAMQDQVSTAIGVEFDATADFPLWVTERNGILRTIVALGAAKEAIDYSRQSYVYEDNVAAPVGAAVDAAKAALASGSATIGEVGNKIGESARAALYGVVAIVAVAGAGYLLLRKEIFG